MAITSRNSQYRFRLESLPRAHLRTAEERNLQINGYFLTAAASHNTSASFPSILTRYVSYNRFRPLHFEDETSRPHDHRSSNQTLDHVGISIPVYSALMLTLLVRDVVVFLLVTSMTRCPFRPPRSSSLHFHLTQRSPANDPLCGSSIVEPWCWRNL